jgi:molybdenum cofactor cytidylyltransferase
MQNIGAVILAAGESSRLGQAKQLLPLRGKSFVRHIVDEASLAGCAPILVVVSPGAKAIEAQLNGTSALLVENNQFARGIGTSIRAGVQRIQDNAAVHGLILLACDQPFVDANIIRQLVALREHTRQPIVASGYAGTLGIPALFDRSCFAELLSLDDSIGAKPVILSNRERVAEFLFSAGKIDIDTAQDYEKLRGEV